MGLVDLPLNIAVNAKGSSTTYNLVHHHLKLDGNGGRPNVDSVLGLVKYLDFLNMITCKELQAFLDRCSFYELVLEVLATKNPVPRVFIDLMDLLAVMVDSGIILDKMSVDRMLVLPGEMAKVNLGVSTMGEAVHVAGNLSNPLAFPTRLSRVAEQEKAFAFRTWGDFLKTFSDQDQRVLFVCVLDMVTNNRLYLNLLWHIHQKLNQVK